MAEIPVNPHYEVAPKVQHVVPNLRAAQNPNRKKRNTEFTRTFDAVHTKIPLRR